MSNRNSVGYVLSGERLVASVLRRGNGRPDSPVRFIAYWALQIEQPTDFPESFSSVKEAVSSVKKVASELGLTPVFSKKGI